MCLGVKGKIVKILDSEKAIVEFEGGIKREIDVSLIKEVSIGDFVIVHVGFAIEKVKVYHGELAN